MKLQSYWTDTVPRYTPQVNEWHATVDVAVVGAGFTGLSAALALAARGANVAVLEAGERVCFEASGRNGGHVNNGLAHDYGALADQVGTDQARAWYRAYDAAVNTVERIVREEAIDCGFARNGKLKLATKPAHYDALARSAERLLVDGVDTDLELLDAARVHAEEIDSEHFAGGLIYKRSAQMHMGRFANGLAAAVEHKGGKIFLQSTVERIERGGNGKSSTLHTTRGVLRAGQVLLANGAGRHGSYREFGWLRRRMVPVGSFIIATAPLGRERAQRLIARRRTCTTVANIHHYFRLTDDDRLILGGRAHFGVSSLKSDARSAPILREGMLGIFPQLADVGIDYCWGGVVDMTRDRLPQAGERDGIWYSTGYSGHGTQMSVHMGQVMARIMSGEVIPNPWGGRAWPAIPGHFGPPWFLPVVGAYYRMKDRFS
jgi:glycine/D-amino acid oxidase-like deaminating enzyme